MGYSPSGLFGYTHMLGGYSGEQARMRAFPLPDVGPLKLPDGIPDEKVVFLSFRPATWQQKTATSARAIRSLCGDVVP
jgi:hypothetical protein